MSKENLVIKKTKQKKKNPVKYEKVRQNHRDQLGSGCISVAKWGGDLDWLLTLEMEGGVDGADMSGRQGGQNVLCPLLSCHHINLRSHHLLYQIYQLQFFQLQGTITQNVIGMNYYDHYLTLTVLKCVFGNLCISLVWNQPIARSFGLLQSLFFSQ